jgi:hypothetical protein
MDKEFSFNFNIDTGIDDDLNDYYDDEDVEPEADINSIADLDGMDDEDGFDEFSDEEAIDAESGEFDDEAGLDTLDPDAALDGEEDLNFDDIEGDGEGELPPDGEEQDPAAVRKPIFIFPDFS